MTLIYGNSLNGDIMSKKEEVKMKQNDRLIVTEVFYQDFDSDDGIPPHWCCKYIENGFVDYCYFSSKDDAFDFAKNHGYFNL